MALAKMIDCMENFSVEELKYFLGDDLVELLIEWLPCDQPTFTHATLSEMIASLYGVKILENKEFRERLIRSLTIKEIESFREFLDSTSSSDTPKQLAKAVANRKWKKNKINQQLLQLLEINDDIFSKEVQNSDPSEIITAGERFYELLDYQFAIRQRILSYLNSGNELTKMIVRMPTGTGKTKTAMHTIIHQYNFILNKNGLVLWIAHTRELLEQAYNTFKNVWLHIGDDEVTAYKMWDNFNLPQQNSPYNGFIFCGIQKLISVAKREPDLFEKIIMNVSLVVVDEAHRAGAAGTKKVISDLMSMPNGACNRSLIGLTATPGRSTTPEENQLFASMFENKVISVDTKLLNELNLSETEAANTKPEQDIIKYFQNQKILASIKREKLIYGELSAIELSQLRTHMTANGYRDVSPKFLETIALNKNRNQKILTRLTELSAQNIPTIVFACSVEHGKMLSAALTLQGIENGHVFGDMDTNDRINVIKRFKNKNDKLNILINYEVLTTGFDATNIRCVFITRPTQSIVLYSQMLGRGLRGPKMGGNSECLLIDIEDNLSRYSTESAAFNSFDNYWK